MNPLTDIPDLWNWCDVDMMGRAEGSLLSTITDQTGQQHGFRQFDNDPDKYPIVRTGVLNGRSVAEGDGIDDVLDTIASVPYGPRTTFVVQRVLSVPEASYAKHPYVSGGGWERLSFVPSSEVWQWYQDYDVTPPGTFTRLNGYARLNEWRLLIYRINDEFSEDVSIDGRSFVSIVPLTHIWSGPSNQTDRLFAHSGSDCCHCQIALHGTVLRAVSGSELENIANFIHRRFNLYPELHMPGKIKEAEALTASGDPGEGGSSLASYGLGDDTTNAALGTDALSSAIPNPGAFEGFHNVAVGNKALALNTTGSYNVAVGDQALGKQTTPFENVAVGQYAGGELLTGAHNTLVGGGGAGGSLTIGADNVAVGYGALQGDNCTQLVAVGYQTLWNHGGTGSVAVGYKALRGAAAGAANNTGVGHQAGIVVSTGDDNTLIGKDAGSTITTGSRNICIGSGAAVGAATDNDWLVIGNAAFETGAVSAAVGTASTHRLRVKIGAGTYYLLATNVA